MSAVRRALVLQQIRKHPGRTAEEIGRVLLQPHLATVFDALRDAGEVYSVHLEGEAFRWYAAEYPIASHPPTAVILTGTAANAAHLELREAARLSRATLLAIRRGDCKPADERVRVAVRALDRCLFASANVEIDA